MHSDSSPTGFQSRKAKARTAALKKMTATKETWEQERGRGSRKGRAAGHSTAADTPALLDSYQQTCAFIVEGLGRRLREVGASTVSR